LRAKLVENHGCFAVEHLGSDNLPRVLVHHGARVPSHAQQLRPRVLHRQRDLLAAEHAPARQSLDPSFALVFINQ
jgi:hypothetical protein